MSDYETIMSDYETKYDINMRHMTVICERRQVKMSGLSHKYVNIYKMVKKVKRRVTTVKRRGRKLQSKAYPTNGMSKFGAIAAGAAAAMAAKAVKSKFFGTQYSAYDKPYGSTTSYSQSTKNAYPINKISKSSEGTGGYSQWSQRYATGKFGKLTTRKIDKLSNDTIIMRHQLIGPFNDYGQRFMYNATNPAGDLYYPLILFELNSTNNYINGVQNFMSPVHQMLQLNGTTNISWEALGGQSTDGTLGVTNWLVEKSGHTQTAVASHPMEKSILKWSSLDLELWGQTQKPTMYTVYLCQLSEDVLPDTTFTTNIGKYSTITNQNACEFWQSMVKRYVYSPLAKIDDGWGRKKIRIMKQYKINIDPTANYENDPDPHVKTLKLFYRFNRKCNFEWKYSNAAGLSIANMNDADWQQEDGENSCQVHPNARLFVMVRASNFVRGSTSTPVNTTMPSISWCMRSCHLINQ